MNTLLAITTICFGFYCCYIVRRKDKPHPMPEEMDNMERQYTYLMNRIARARGENEFNYLHHQITTFYNRFCYEPGIIAQTTDLRAGLDERIADEIIAESMMSEC